MAQTIGHSAAHGGLRGHSINDEIYPFVVVATGNPHINRCLKGGLRWKVRHPDGHFMTGGGFFSAEQAYAKAKDAKLVWDKARQAQ